MHIVRVFRHAIVGLIAFVCLTSVAFGQSTDGTWRLNSLHCTGDTHACAGKVETLVPGNGCAWSRNRSTAFTSVSMVR